MTGKLWGCSLATNFEFEPGDPIDNWLLTHVLQAMTEIEMLDFPVKLITLVKRNTFIEIRAYPLNRKLNGCLKMIGSSFGPPCDPCPSFTTVITCTQCKRETNYSHDRNECLVQTVMEG